MSPATVFLICGLIGSVMAIAGFFLGAILCRNSIKEQTEERYRQGYNAGQRVGWYEAADEIDALATRLTAEGYAHRAGMCKSMARHLNDYFDAVDGGKL